MIDRAFLIAAGLLLCVLSPADGESERFAWVAKLATPQPQMLVGYVGKARADELLDECPSFYVAMGESCVVRLTEVFTELPVWSFSHFEYRGLG